MVKRFLSRPSSAICFWLFLWLIVIWGIVTIANRHAIPTTSPAPSPSAPVEPSYDSTLAKAIVDTAAIEDVAVWHIEHDRSAVQGLGWRKRSLERRTSLILDHGTREAGRAFLAAITETIDDNEDLIYTLDAKRLEGIDPDKLKRWAAIALTVLEIVEPFVPPPYNLGVHAAVMLLKLYLSQPDATPRRIVGETY